jgi:Thiamine pyrophosphate enzyme, C-terminal TPP binding domain
VDLKNPDFAAMARAMGIHARRVEDPGDLPATVKEMLGHDGPALLDVVTAVDAAYDNARASQGLQPLGTTRRDERSRRRGGRSGEDELASAISVMAA